MLLFDKTKKKTKEKGAVACKGNLSARGAHAHTTGLEEEEKK